MLKRHVLCMSIVCSLFTGLNTPVSRAQELYTTAATHAYNTVAAASSDATFPLRISSNGRYLVDQSDRPFLIKEISAWGLAQTLSEADAEAFMDSVKERGFNTLLVSAISADQRFAGFPPTWNGVEPFTSRWDFSTPNPDYFAHLDRVLHAARSRGMLVLLVPSYLGYAADATQGWADKLLSEQNSPSKSREYGRFLGQRYANTPNLVWVAGGDNDGAGSLYEHMHSIIVGIKEFDSHLWTGHFDMTTTWATNNPLYAQYMDLDALYLWTESMSADGPQYVSERLRYPRGKLMFQMDQSYEHDVPFYDDNLNPQWIRRKNYEGLLSGCAGTSFAPGMSDLQLYPFHDWRALMSTNGMTDAQRTFALFESRPWHDLVPDLGNAVLVAGAGSWGSLDYAVAARTSSGDTVMAYIPSGRMISVDMTQVSGSAVTAHWFDPSTGQASLIGTFPAEGVREFQTPPGDAVLVLDNAGLGLPAPGY